MTIEDFRKGALALDGAEEGAHMGNADFRVGGRIFATLAHASSGFGNLKLTPELQAAMVQEWPQWFEPIAGGWGRMGMTHVRLATVPPDVMQEALRAAWKLAREKNVAAKRKPRSGGR